MRGIAIIMIFLVHYGQTFGNYIITQFGQMGCQMFIFASGYTCCFSLKRSGTKRDFYKKRFLSIAPGFYTALIVVVVANLLFNQLFGRAFVGVGNTQLTAVLCNIALINGVLSFCNNSVFPGGWFIGSIWLLYMLHPFIFKLYEEAKNKWILTIILTFFGTALTAVLNYLFTGSIAIKNNSFEYYMFTNQLGCYTLGINLYYLRKDNNDNRRLWLTVVLLIVFLVTTIVAYYSKMAFRYFFVCPLMGCFSLFFYLLLCEIPNNKHISRVVSLIGEHSLYIFLTHSIAVWTIAGGLKRLLQSMKWIIIDDMTAFFILLLPCAVITIVLCICLKKAVSIEKDILKI